MALKCKHCKIRDFYNRLVVFSTIPNIFEPVFSHKNTKIAEFTIFTIVTSGKPLFQICFEAIFLLEMQDLQIFFIFTSVQFF